MSEKEPVEAPLTATATAIPVAAAPPVIQMHLQEKQGAKCCGCWCDYRRAVIIIAIVFMVLSLIGIIGALGAAAVPTANIGIEDDEIEEIWRDGIKRNAIFSGIALLSSACALIGARNYNIYLVAVNIVWIVVSYIAGIVIEISTANEVNDVGYERDGAAFVPYSPSIAGFVINGIVSLLFIYPHAGFIHEVNQGIMSAETYPREEFSCCCVDRRR